MGLCLCMRVVVLALILFIAAPCAAFAESAAARPAPAAREARFSHGLLWRVDAIGAKPSYLFGTIHTDDDRVLALPVEVQRALDGAKVFVPEVLDDEASIRKFLAAMVTREPRLPELLGEADYARVDQLLGEHSIPSEARPRFRPWAAMITLLQPRGATGLVLDRVLAQEARQHGKRIEALETIEEQIEVFAGMAQETQVRLLREAVAHYPDIQDAVRPLVEAYLARDLDRMWQLNVEAMAGTGEARADNDLLLRRVLYDRNERFAQRLGPLLRAGGVFAAFGALHLRGERGVLDLLQRRGFKVRRIY